MSFSPKNTCSQKLQRFGLVSGVLASLKPRPSFASDNAANLRLPNPEISGQLCLRHTPGRVNGPDFKNLNLCEFVGWLTFAPGMSTVSHHVCHISLMSVPSKVLRIYTAEMTIPA